MHIAKRDGFTLLELMITSLILGLLLSIAVPSFMSYQARSRRTEAFANLQAISRAQTTYKAERDTYFGTLLNFPDFTAQNSGVLGTRKMVWDAASQAAFADIGWSPEGRVFYAYEVNTGCGCTDCFTASAFGDVDGNGIASAAMFVHPGPDSSVCPSIQTVSGSPFGTPTRFNSGAAVYDEVAINRSTDEY